VNVGSEVSLDLNLALIRHDNPGGHLSFHGHSGSTFSNVGDYEERLDDSAGCYNPVTLMILLLPRPGSVWISVRIPDLCCIFFTTDAER